MQVTGNMGLSSIIFIYSRRLKPVISDGKKEGRVDHLFRTHQRCKAHDVWLKIYSPSHQRRKFSACWSWDSGCRRTSAWPSSSGWEISLLGFAELVVKESRLAYIMVHLLYLKYLTRLCQKYRFITILNSPKTAPVNTHPFILIK